MKLSDVINTGDKIRVINNDEDEDIIEGKVYEVISYDGANVYVEDESGLISGICKVHVELI